MNWIEIDQILYKIILKNDSIENIYTEAEARFKWNRSQTRDAVDPLIKRHSALTVDVKVESKPTRKRASKKS
jgi:hypothetical protein